MCASKSRCGREIFGPSALDGDHWCTVAAGVRVDTGRTKNDENKLIPQSKLVNLQIALKS